MTGLTRLHTLCLEGRFRNQHNSLAALGSTLQSLTLEDCDSLPSCLPEMLALRTLVSLRSVVFVHCTTACETRLQLHAKKRLDCKWTGMHALLSSSVYSSVRSPGPCRLS